MHVYVRVVTKLVSLQSTWTLPFQGSTILVVLLWVLNSASRVSRTAIIDMMALTESAGSLPSDSIRAIMAMIAMSEALEA